MRLVRIAAVATATGMAMLAMSACGTEKADEASNLTVDAKTLAQQTQQKVKETKTVRITGGGTGDMGDGEIMQIGAEMCFGSDKTMKGKIKYDKAELELLVVDGKSYTKGSRATWDAFWSGIFGLDDPAASAETTVDRAAYDEMLRLLDNRWLQEDADLEDDKTGLPSPGASADASPDASGDEEGDDVYGGFADFTDIQDLFGDNYDKVVKGDPVEYEGKRVIPLTVKDEETGEVTTVYVPEKGTQIPVRIAYETPGTPDKAEFKVTTGGGDCGVKAPAAGELVDKAAYEAVSEKVFKWDFDMDEEGGTEGGPSGAASGRPTGGGLAG